MAIRIPLNIRTVAALAGLLLVTALQGCSSGRSVVSPSTGGSAAAALAAAGTATLDWQPPTQNTDGTPLTDLAGFHIYYGTDSNTLGRMVDVASPTTTVYTIDNLAPGTYYFALTSYTAAGVESELSAIVSKAV